MSSRTVLTTGANGGLGLATVIEMARRGHRSVGTVRSEVKAEEVLAACRAESVDVEVEILDVTDADAGVNVIDTIRPDVLVNNAGYMLYSAIEEVSDDEARALLETMVVAPIRLARQCIPHMRDNGWGRIIQISSLSARASFPLMGWYQGAKHALEGVSDALRLEVAGDGIAVTLIEPGVFRSELSEEFVDVESKRGSRYEKAYAASQQMFGRMDRFMTEPETVAKVIAKAAETRSPKARYAVGLDAQFQILTGPLTPTGLRDFALRKSSGL
jgi:NAD(P)-dependent dehydrogenase (short-subunit alcohol dehydrogenase family)